MSDLVPWSDAGWVEQRRLVRHSPCCKDAVWSSLADGVVAGSCARCGEWVVRLNPKTRKQEVPLAFARRSR